MELILKMYSESIWLHKEIYQEKLIILELRILILGMSSENMCPLDETYNEKFNIFRSSVLHVKTCSLLGTQSRRSAGIGSTRTAC